MAVAAAAAVAATSEEELCGQGSPGENCQARSGEGRRATEDEREEALYVLFFAAHNARGKIYAQQGEKSGH